LGGNLGHLARLEVIARDFQTKGIDVTFAIRRFEQFSPWLLARGWKCMAAPRPHQTARLSSDAACHAELLLNDGFGDVDSLRSCGKEWQALLAATKPDFTVVEFAPLATYFLRLFGVRVVVVSTGFCAPPYFDRPTFFRPWDEVTTQRAVSSHQHVMALFDSHKILLGSAAPACFDDLYEPSSIRLFTFSELDHFANRQGSNRYLGSIWADVGDSDVAWQSVDEKTSRVFAYLNGDAKKVREVFAALRDLGNEVIAVTPGLNAEEINRLSTHKFRILKTTVALSAILPLCTLVVCHGGQALVSRSLCAGVPVFLTPIYAEQALMSRRIRAQLLGSASVQTEDSLALKAKIELMQKDKSIADAVSAFSKKYRGQNSVSLLKDLVPDL
jgi:hypothetical protein